MSDLWSPNLRRRWEGNDTRNEQHEAWRLGDASSKRDLLVTLFDEIDVFDGRIVAVKPRADRIVEVTDLIDRAYDEPLPGGPGGLLGVGREGSRPTSNKPRIRV